ncbi:hypothetical protein ACFWIB_28945 [Streptomyces sp. NPDC127051]|uniref:hypothetical protein n=1 Tax=Streptomyces sp. NPDC127051 TaxID=3347119 RepID=UPI0036640835
MEPDERPPGGGGDGCLVGVIRIPVKIVAVLVILPVRVVWELLVALGRAAHRHVLVPLYVHVVEPALRVLGRVLATLLKLVLVWPWVGLWRYVVTPVGRGLARLGRGAYAHLLAPVGRVLTAYVFRPLWAALTWAGRGGLRYLLAPLGHGLAWLAAAAYRNLLRPVGLGLVWLAVALYRYVLAPLGQVLLWAWHVAGRVAGALWRGLKWVGWVLVGWPAAQVYRHVLTPVGHVVRDAWRSIRTTVREVRAEVRRALFGGPGREPARSQARTLGSTTAERNTPAPERSLHKQG